MRITMRTMLVVSACLVPLAISVLGQSASSKAATYITKEEIDTVNKQPGGDRQIRVVDIGHENFAVGIVHRGATGAAARGAGGGGGAAARANTPPPEPCGDKSATPPPAGSPSGLTHDHQTEGYYIVSGGGKMVTGGRIVNGRRSAPESAVTRSQRPHARPRDRPDFVNTRREGRRHHHHSAEHGAGLLNIPDHVYY